MNTEEEIKCKSCNTPEGAFHEIGCGAEACPFCEDMLAYCLCFLKQLGIWEKIKDLKYEEMFKQGYGYLLTNVKHENGKQIYIMDFGEKPCFKRFYELPAHLLQKWEQMLLLAGRRPYISCPLKCDRCGILEPEMFYVEPWAWKRYVGSRERFLCLDCFKYIKARVDQIRGKPQTPVACEMIPVGHGLTFLI